MTLRPWRRAGALLLGLALCLATAGCGIAAAAAAAAIEDEINGGNDGPPDNRPVVAVVHSLPAAHASDVVDQLKGTGLFKSVASIDASASTPAINQISAYAAVLVVSDGPFGNAAALGDLLAQYSGNGGGVVCATFARPGGGLGGAWAADDFHAIAASGTASGDGPIAWGVDAPLHPIVLGVALTGAGTGSDRPDVATATAGSALIASWATGEALLAVRQTATGHRVADAGFYPVTDAVAPSLLPANSGGDDLLARALLWTAGKL